MLRVSLVETVSCPFVVKIFGMDLDTYRFSSLMDSAPGGNEMAEGVFEFTDQNFETDVIDSDTPTLVDFWAEWCAPCKMIAPTVEALAQEYAGKVRIGKLNIDENPSVPTKFGIRGIPTLMLFKGGEIVEQVVGVKSKADLKAAIDRAL